MNIRELSKKYEQYIIDMRRELHMHPELSLAEERTSRRVQEELAKMGIPFVQMAGTGVLATISGKRPGKTIALRADMDALEITERNDVPYKSQTEGVMHACGHDAHTSMLLGAAKILSEIKDEFYGTVKLIFQPGEEVAKGAKLMIAAGALAGVDEIFGMHVMSEFAAGTVALSPGPRMASCDIFKITVTGKGGHGSTPNAGVDALAAAASIVMNLQTIVSREVSPLEPLTVSVGKMVSGTRFNVIADSAVLEGTTRCFSYEVQDMLPAAMERIIKETAASFRAEAELEYERLTVPVINNPASTARGRKAIAKILSEEAAVQMPMTMGAEDFSEYLINVPGAMAFLGIFNEAKGADHPIHHPQFNVDENALSIGAALHAQYAVDFLNEGK